ncbi:MAG: RdgB/HAM1 family non-canonical purine NTP pyrophosphatase [Methylococcaceae bacterium]|jgi:XTP/dITP diphosphohydrolase
MVICNGLDLVLATGNTGKIKEFQALLADYHIIGQAQHQVPECEETGLSFVENAILKARNASLYSHLPALADDSGLVVDALDGAPGIYSARYAGQGASDPENIEKLLQAMAEVPSTQRSARFICVLVFMASAQDPCPIIAQGVWEGSILTQPIGENGFGYDPIFGLPDQPCSAAQLSPEAKNRLSHRAMALTDLRLRLKALQA